MAVRDSGKEGLGCRMLPATTRTMLRQKGSAGDVYMFYKRVGIAEAVKWGLVGVQIGRGVVRRGGKDVALVAYGTMVNNALAAAEMLAKSGVTATVADMR